MRGVHPVTEAEGDPRSERKLALRMNLEPTDDGDGDGGGRERLGGDDGVGEGSGCTP